jgi:hypothetical protein
MATSKYKIFPALLTPEDHKFLKEERELTHESGSQTIRLALALYRKTKNK